MKSVNSVVKKEHVKRLDTPEPTQPLIPITVVVPTKNEEANLGRCLDHLNRFSEVIVVDSCSTDNTPSIAKERAATYIEFRWNGKYPKKRNWLLLNHQLANSWVLFLDADEFVDDNFCDEAQRVIKTGNCNAYWINYTNYFLGRRLDYGVRQRKLALMRVDAGLYEKIDEDDWSNLDMEIHEHPIIEGPIGEIRSVIEHNDDRGITKFVSRHLEYAKWESKRFRLLQRTGGVELSSLTSRQRFKYKHLGKLWYPWVYFLHTYVVKLGFLDGRAGFAYAFNKLWYFYTIRLMLLEQKNDDPS